MQLILVVSYLKENQKYNWMPPQKWKQNLSITLTKALQNFSSLPSALVIISDKLMVSYPHAGEGYVGTS